MVSSPRPSLAAALVAVAAGLVVAACGPASIPSEGATPKLADVRPMRAHPVDEAPAEAAPARAPVAVCDDARAALTRLRAPSGPPSPPHVELASISPLLAAIDADLGTNRATELELALLDASAPAARIAALAAVDATLSAWLREQLRRAAEVAEERPLAWARAECAWELLAPGLVDALAQEGLGEAIAERFVAGRVALAGPAEGWDHALLPGRQAIEKRVFTAAHRRLLAEATAAREAGDPLAARRAAAAFALIRDRLQDKNTPAIAPIEAMLAGPPAAIDPAWIARELAIAFAKRARKYCSEVASHPELRGSAAGLASVTEGATYGRLILPDMAARLGAGFSAAKASAAWDALLQEVEAGDDADEISRLSDELVQWNCAYQEALGIAECTWTHDQVAAPAPAK